MTLINRERERERELPIFFKWHVISFVYLHALRIDVSSYGQPSLCFKGELHLLQNDYRSKEGHMNVVVEKKRAERRQT
jgi:hypothetical protein